MYIHPDHYVNKIFDHSTETYKDAVTFSSIREYQENIFNGRVLEIEVDSSENGKIAHFHNPSFKFIIQKEMNDLINQLNSNYLNDEHYNSIIFIINNLQKQYIDNLDENASFGIENDFKKIDSQRKRLIKVLDRFSKRYKLNDNTAPQLTSIKFSFSNGDNITVDNFLIINDILTIYLEQYDFDTSSSKWQSEIEKYLIGFNVEKLEQKTRRNTALSIYKYLIDKGIIEVNDNKIPNRALRIINIIFSLASVPVNSSTCFYDRYTTQLNSYYSTKEIDVLNNWIKRYPQKP